MTVCTYLFPEASPKPAQLSNHLCDLFVESGLGTFSGCTSTGDVVRIEEVHGQTVSVLLRVNLELQRVKQSVDRDRRRATDSDIALVTDQMIRRMWPASTSATPG